MTVVDRDNYFTFHALIGEMVTGRILPSNILNPSRRVFAPAQVHVGEIETIDIDEKKVVTRNRFDGIAVRARLRPRRRRRRHG